MCHGVVYFGTRTPVGSKPRRCAKVHDPVAYGYNRAFPHQREGFFFDGVEYGVHENADVADC